MNKKQVEKLKQLNGYYRLNENLQQKLDQYDNAIKPKISKFFTWDEFCEIFIKTTSIFVLKYKDIGLELINDSKVASCVITDEFCNHFVQNFKSAQDMLNNADINGCRLQDIWSDLL